MYSAARCKIVSLHHLSCLYSPNQLCHDGIIIVAKIVDAEWRRERQSSVYPISWTSFRSKWPRYSTSLKCCTGHCLPSPYLWRRRPRCYNGNEGTIKVNLWLAVAIPGVVTGLFRQLLAIDRLSSSISWSLSSCQRTISWYHCCSST